MVEVQKKALKEALAHAATGQPLGEPLDGMEIIQSEKWKRNNSKSLYFRLACSFPDAAE